MLQKPKQKKDSIAIDLHVWYIQRMLKELEKPERMTLLTFKVTKKQIEQLKAKADKYAGGNISAWLRYSALKYCPDKKELVRD